MLTLNESYSREDFLDFLNDFLPDFEKDVRKINPENLKAIKNAVYLGRSKELDLQVFELTHKVSSGARVTLTTDGFRIMKQSAGFQALAIFRSDDNEDWRLSLMIANPKITEKGKATISFSNPKRYSFFLGPNAKINTPTEFLLNREKVVNTKDLLDRFSMEVVNKDFYKEISKAFTELVNGQLKLPSTEDKTQASLEFAVRLIGRIIFCWFLREKKSDTKLSLMPKNILSLTAVKQNTDYYHKILEPVFFEVLNKQVKSRKEEFSKEPFSLVPYLNGGLFSPQEDDFYRRGNGDQQSQFNNTLIVPDSWFKSFFETLETYNFTIDENTSYDEELSIDPEMLGRIFENLLAEINPETGESARKSTGSYYTPRTIVNYMIDESLLLYLKGQTKINEDKLRAAISYDLIDDSKKPLNITEKEEIIDALEKVKILDPACGSGAFPIGALQKIVFILQQTDPEGKIWFEKQINNIPPEIKNLFEREFKNKNFDYIRKLGIIRENIYGIDIQPIASEISRLRCFLTLIVDQKIQEDLDNRGIEPLPNLDFKFVTANTLINLPKSEKLKDNSSEQIAMFDDNKKIDELKQVRDQYFTSSGIEREQFKSEFSKIQKDLIFQLIQNHGLMSLFKADLTRKLTEWDPFSHKASGWFDPEWMFGISDGFDIVIANPPYVSVKEIPKNDKKTYNQQFETGKGRFNLFTLFLERSQKLLKQNGILTYILPEGLYSNVEYIYIRKYLLNQMTISNISLFSKRVFEAAVDTSVICLSNTKFVKGLFPVYLDLSKLLAFLDQSDFNNLPFSLFSVNLDNNSSAIIKKVLNGFKVKVGEVLEIQQGIIYSGQKKEDVFSNEQLNSNYKQILDGRDVLKWHINWEDKLENKYILYSDKLHRPREERLFLAKEKLVFPRKSVKISGAYDYNQYYCLNTVYVCLPKKDGYSLKYILAILNSKLINYFYKKLFFGWQVTIPALNCISMPNMNQNKITKKVDSILELKSSDQKTKVESLEREIDQIIYQLYGLTGEEIKIVEGKSETA